MNDEINITIVKPIPLGNACLVGAFLLFFSWTENVLIVKGITYVEDHTNSITDKYTKVGVAICISSCDDGQLGYWIQH